MIKDKWKIFSMRQCFSNEMTESECLAHFDALMAQEDTDGCRKYLDDGDLIPWHPFEFMHDGEFVEHISANAQYAQSVEEQG